MKAPTPPNETRRLEALRQYDVLDTPPEQAFDDLTLLAAHICQAPMAMVSLVDDQRQWFKSKIGVTAAETSRDIAFCAHTILHKDEVLEVRDAELDPRFADSLLVTGDPHVRFYAGAPLVTPGGHALGALCVMDRSPRKLTAEQLAALRALSRHVVAQLELRRNSMELKKEAADRAGNEARLRQQFDELSASKAAADRLLALAQKSRRALLSVLEDEKLAGQNLRESEQKFRQLADNITDVFWITSPDFKAIHYISAGYEAIWGSSKESLYANPHQWVEAILPEERERAFASFALLRSRPEVSVEYRIARPDGTVRWIHDRGFQVRDEAGNVVRLTGIATDITERKRTEGRVATQSAISRALVDSNTLKEAAPKIMRAICESEGWDFGVIWEADKKCNLLRCVETWHRPELPAQNLAALSHGLTFAAGTGMTGRAWAGGKPVSIPDITQVQDFLHADVVTGLGLRSALAFPVALEGEVRWVLNFLGREINGPDETVLDMLAGVGSQIGAFFKRTRLEDQFRQSQKLEGIGQLAGGVAHDFNNILAAIQMQSDLLKGGGGLSPDQLEFANEISTTVQRAAALTRQLLLFSRREVFQPRDLELSESIANTAKMLKRLLGEQVEMQFKLASQPMFIHADAGMMDQVLLNLAVNARDAMPNGGQLVIETSGVEIDEFAAGQSAEARPGSFVCLSVSDTGCGIPPEILPKIFEPFFTTKDVGKGTGLGLATVFGIAQQHQGWVNVYSEVGHGTTFRVYLPRLARNAGAQSAQLTPTAMRGGNETILLVEDDPSLRVSVRKILSQLGYRILEAPTGVKALDVWKQNRGEIGLLLTDLVMPDGMTGKDLAQRVHQEDPKLKVIYMSGYSAEVVGKDFPLKEGDNFLTKPFKTRKLAEAIRGKLDDRVEATAVPV